MEKMQKSIKTLNYFVEAAKFYHDYYSINTDNRAALTMLVDNSTLSTNGVSIALTEKSTAKILLKVQLHSCPQKY